MSSALLMASCCCGAPPCTTCCFKFTFSGDFLYYGLLIASQHNAGQGLGTGSDGHDAQITATEGSLSALILCGAPDAGEPPVYTATLPYATRIEYTGADTLPDYNECGHATLTWKVNIDGTMLIRVFIVDSIDFNEVFNTTVTLPTEILDALAGDPCSVAVGISVSGSNSLTYAPTTDTVYPYTSGSGSVLVEYVDACTHTDYAVDCTTTGGFAQTICDEDDCPCGRTDAQPTCLLTTIKGSDGVDSVYQNGTVISGSGGRLYTFSGPYRRDDGTWWRFVVATDSPTTPAWNSDGAYFEHQCPGDNLDSYSGTYTYSDAGDWTGTVATVLTNHQTALTNIGTTVTVAACVCDEALDLYVVTVQCTTVGTTPSGWSDIEVDRDPIDECKWGGTDGTHTIVMTYVAGTWTCTITRNSDAASMIEAIWSGTANDPTGSHGYDTVDAGWDAECSGVGVVIS